MCFSEGVPRGQGARTESSQASDVMGKAAQGPYCRGGSVATTNRGYGVGGQSQGEHRTAHQPGGDESWKARVPGPWLPGVRGL